MTSSGTVLIVDDDESICYLVRTNIEMESNYEVVGEAHDGDEAITFVQKERPDFVIMDQLMPKVDGFSVLERLQDDGETRSIPVVVLTARRLSEEERRSLQQRAVSVLQKSDYSASELRKLIRRALGAESSATPSRNASAEQAGVPRGRAAGGG